MLPRLFYSKCRRAIWLSCLLCGCFISANAQYFSLDSNRKRMVIPFRFIRNLVIIKLNINNTGPFNFILDTGVGQMLITEPSLVDSINLASKRTVIITGFGEGEDQEAYITTPLTIGIKGMKSHYVSAAILKKDIFGLSAYAGMRIHGLLGYEFFSRLVVKINFSDSLITVYRPGKIKGFKKGSKIPLTIEGNRAYIQTVITCNDGTKKLSKLIIDIGAGHAVSLENITDKNIFSKTLIKGNLGVGLKGLISGYIGRIEEIDIGKYKLNNVVTSFPEDNFTKSLNVARDGNLGMEVLKKFMVILDYTDSVMYLKSSVGYNAPFEHDMSGLEYYATGNNFSHVIIDRVEPGSAGEEAGLQKDDEIMAINFRPVASMSLEQIDEIFRSRNNRTILLDIYHDQKYTMVITLKRRI
ncbi:MAG: hypothetical protein JWQ06_2470 [Mucilaginibacter sp.]|nr:hypothetical protein [Mucilaginibacter sp.]